MKRDEHAAVAAHSMVVYWLSIDSTMVKFICTIFFHLYGEVLLRWCKVKTKMAARSLREEPLRSRSPMMWRCHFYDSRTNAFIVLLFIIVKYEKRLRLFIANCQKRAHLMTRVESFEQKNTLDAVLLIHGGKKLKKMFIYRNQGDQNERIPCSMCDDVHDQFSSLYL